MRNFPVEHEGKTYWISRSVAVAGFIFTKDSQGNWLVLANKRGPGCPDNVGKWVCPCGYLDYDETLKTAIIREVYEETGVLVPADKLQFAGIDDVPEGRQNLTVKFTAYLGSDSPAVKMLSKEHCEPDEVDEVMWIPVAKVGEYDWAFGHYELIRSFVP